MEQKKFSPWGLYPVNHTPLFLILRGLIEDKQKLWYSKHQDSQAHKRMHCLPSNLQCCFWDEKKMCCSCNRYLTCELMGFSLVEKKLFFLSFKPALFFPEQIASFFSWLFATYFLYLFSNKAESAFQLAPDNFLFPQVSCSQWQKPGDRLCWIWALASRLVIWNKHSAIKVLLYTNFQSFFFMSTPVEPHTFM